jgi:hypothetical protein
MTAITGYRGREQDHDYLVGQPHPAHRHRGVTRQLGTRGLTTPLIPPPGENVTSSNGLCIRP